MLRRTLIASALLILPGLMSATRVNADELAFSYGLNGTTFAWQLPASPVIGPGDYVLGTLFDISDVPFSENGVPQGAGFFDFYNLSDGGGFDLIVGGVPILNEYGQQIYTGPESTPTFLVGTPVNLNDGKSDGPTGGLTTKTVSTPEPSSLLLLGGGLLSLIGLAWKRRVAAQSVS
jgi:PEP-CTERM motif